MREWLVIIPKIGIERFTAYTKSEARSKAKKFFEFDSLPVGTLVYNMSGG